VTFRPCEGLFGLRSWADDPALRHLLAAPVCAVKAAPAAVAGLRPRIGCAGGSPRGSSPSASGEEPSGAPSSRARPGTPQKEGAEARRRGGAGATGDEVQDKLWTPSKRARQPRSAQYAAEPPSAAEGDAPRVRRRRTGCAGAEGLTTLLAAAEALARHEQQQQQMWLAQPLPASAGAQPDAANAADAGGCAALGGAACTPVTPLYPRSHLPLSPNPPQPECPLSCASEALPVTLGEAICAQLVPVVGRSPSLLSRALWAFARTCALQGRREEAAAAAAQAWKHFLAAAAAAGTASGDLAAAWETMTAEVARATAMAAA